MLLGRKNLSRSRPAPCAFIQCWNLAAGTEYGSRGEACAAASQLQQQQRHQTYRELPLYSRSMKPGCSWRTLTRTRTLCQLLAGLVALTVIFHAASCGFFFCIRFPRALEFPHDMYHDIRDIYILAGMGLHTQLCLSSARPHHKVDSVDVWHDAMTRSLFCAECLGM